MGRQRRDGIENTLLALHDYLTAQQWPVVFEQETAATITSRKITGVSSAQLHEVCDLIIVVGGDGSLLHTAHFAIKQNLPVLGVNRGRLGFLTDIRPHELHKIVEILQGSYIEEQRFMLEATVYRQKKITATLSALNEVVLSPGKIAQMIEFEVIINDQFVYDQKADGLIIATPTGSTAYALSGGGPIIHPSLDAMVLVPMFPHTLSNRPVVIDANSHITIRIPQHNDIHPLMSSDGQNPLVLFVEDVVQIAKKTKNLRLIHPLDYNYFETLRSKLGWQRKHFT